MTEEEKAPPVWLKEGLEQFEAGAIFESSMIKGAPEQQKYRGVLFIPQGRTKEGKFILKEIGGIEEIFKVDQSVFRLAGPPRYEEAVYNIWKQDKEFQAVPFPEWRNRRLNEYAHHWKNLSKEAQRVFVTLTSPIAEEGLEGVRSWLKQDETTFTSTLNEVRQSPLVSIDEADEIKISDESKAFIFYLRSIDDYHAPEDLRKYLQLK